MVRIKVKEIAKSKGISQSKLSRLADVNVSTLQRIYRNPTETNINIFTLEKIAKALGVDVSELIEALPSNNSVASLFPVSTCCLRSDLSLLF